MGSVYVGKFGSMESTILVMRGVNQQECLKLHNFIVKLKQQRIDFI